MSVYPSVCGGQGRDRPLQRVWRGLWRPMTAYGPDEVVHVITGDAASEPGALYLSIQTNLSNTANCPGSGEDWQKMWELFAQPGDPIPVP